MPAELRQPAQLLRARDLQVMAGHGLVEEQVLHVVLGSRAQAVDVRLEVAGATALDAARRVVVGVVALERLHRAHAVGQPRQFGEKLRQLRVHPLGDVAIADEQVLAARVVELRRVVQEPEEFGARADESRAPDQRIHLRADALDFAQAEFVDRARRERDRRSLADQRLVVGRAAG